MLNAKWVGSKSENPGNPGNGIRLKAEAKSSVRFTLQRLAREFLGLGEASPGMKIPTNLRWL